MTDIETVIKNISRLEAGVIDTSTLIYLAKLDMLLAASRTIRLFVLPQVRTEYGEVLPQTLHSIPGPDGSTDRVLIGIAEKSGLPVFSEDKQILRAAERAGLMYYNTLMLVLALHGQQVINSACCRRTMDDLARIAHYSQSVLGYGEQVYEQLGKTFLRSHVS